MSQPTLLLKGSFDSFSIDDVLDVVGMSRQTMRVVLNDDGRGGEFLVKAGRVIRAEAPPDRGRRAFVNIYREPGQGFAVWQHVEAIGEPIGMLADLIEEAKALEEAPIAPSRTPMLAGSFSDHRLDEVLDVLNMTRQLVEFKCHRDDESSVIMLLKSGQVLACEDLRNSTNGLPAFKSLFKDPGQTFEVVRLDARAQGELPPRIGTLSALVAEARKNDDQEGKKRPGVLFQGAFKNFPLSDVLEALSVTRLTVEMVFHDSDGTRGTFVLKAGQVLAAQALRTGSSHREAFLELMAEPGESFIVVRRPGIPAGEPIGRLRDLLSETRTPKKKKKKKTIPPATASNASASTSGTRRVTKLRPAPPPVPRAARTKVATPPPAPGRERQSTQRTTRGPAVPPPVPTAAAKPKPKAKPTPSIGGNKPVATIPRKSANSVEIVLDGTFDSFSIEDVVEVLGLSRQYVALGTLRNGAPLARLVVKSGRLLMASYGSVKEPKKALRMLFDDPGTEFRVRRLPRYADNDLGSFAELVEEVKRAKDASTVIHLPNKAKPAPKPEPEPEPDDDLGVDLDELFAEEEPPAPKPAPRKPKGGRKPYRPPERKKKTTEVADTKVAVEAKKPETKAPEVKPPEAKKPPTKAPEIKAPEAKKPETKAPEAKKPETKAPEAKKPETKAPEAKKPETKAPEAKKPETKAPEAKKPEAKAPEATKPEAKKPEPTPEANKPEPPVEAPAKVAAAAAAPIAASPESTDAIVHSLQLIEKHLREGGGAVGSDEAVKALHQIDEHIGTLTESVKDLAKHMDQMRDKMVAEARTTRTAMVFLQLLALVGIAALFLNFMR